VPAEDLLRTLAAGIQDPRLLQAFTVVPRDEFVPPEWRARAYEDTPLPIPHGLVTTQPSLIATMIGALALEGEERVLEIGTGYGYQTALLAVLADEVYSVERWADLAHSAQSNLARRGIANAHVRVGDGTKGLPEEAPFDDIVVAAASPRVPSALAEQLVAGGRLVQPIGPGGNEQVSLFVKEVGGLRRADLLMGANFVRLIGAEGVQEA